MRTFHLFNPATRLFVRSRREHTWTEWAGDAEDFRVDIAEGLLRIYPGFTMVNERLDVVDLTKAMTDKYAHLTDEQLAAEVQRQVHAHPSVNMRLLPHNVPCADNDRAREILDELVEVQYALFQRRQAVQPGLIFTPYSPLVIFQ